MSMPNISMPNISMPNISMPTVHEPKFSLAVKNPNGREMTFADAAREALAEEMRRDPRVFIIGEEGAQGHGG